MSAKYKLIAMLPAVLLASASYAEDLSYTFGQIDYLNLDGDVENVNIDGDGIGLLGSAAVAENFFVLGSYSNVEVDVGQAIRGADLQTFSFGGGAHFPLAPNFDIVGTLRYVNIDVENADDDGFALGLGLRNFATPQFEWSAMIDYIDLEDFDRNGDFSFGAEGRYHFTPALSLGVGINADEDFDVFTYNAGLRFELR